MTNELSYILRLKDEATQTLQKFSGSIGTAGSGLQEFGKKAMVAGAAITASTIPLMLYGKSAFDLAQEIELAWVGVRKVYDGTAESVNNELIPAAKRLSIEFGRNKLDVIGVMDALAAMGETGPGLIDKTTQAMQFAVLGGLDLDQAIRSVIATSAIFGVKGEELTKMLATMNTTENAGATSMADLGDAISTVGNVAKVSGVDIKELNSFMSVLRLRGIEAGEGANALKTIFTRLRRPSEEASEIMKKYGISIEETTMKTGTFTKVVGGNAEELKKLQKVLESKTASLAKYQQGISGANLSDEARGKTVDKLRKEIENTNKAIADASGVTQSYTGTQMVSTGKLKDADQILNDIAKSWKKMTDAEREEISFSLGTMFQKDKFLALMDDLNSSNSEYSRILLAQGDDALNVAKYFEELGIAQESNAFKVQQSTQRFAEMKETLGLLLLEILVPIIDTLSDLALKFSELDPSIQKVITVFGLLLVVVGPLLVIFGTLAFAIGSLGIPLALLIAVVAGSIIIFVAFKDTILEFLNTVWAKFLETFTWIKDLIFTKVDEWYQKNKEFVDLVIIIFQTLWNFLKWVWETIRTLVEFTLKGILAIAETQLQLLKVAFEKVFEVIKSVVQTGSDFIHKIFGDKLDAMGNKAESTKEWIIGIFKKMAEGITNALKAIKFPHLKVGEGSINVAGKDIAYPKLDVDWYEKGGWVRNTGLAMVHGGEYVLSKEMLNGKQPVPNSISNNTNNTPINVTAIINTPLDAFTLGNILGEQLAFARV